MSLRQLSSRLRVGSDGALRTTGESDRMKEKTKMKNTEEKIRFVQFTPAGSKLVLKLEQMPGYEVHWLVTQDGIPTNTLSVNDFVILFGKAFDALGFDVVKR